MRVFLDANIFFAAAGSPKGGSAFVLELAKKKEIKAVTVMHALLEAERNIQNKLKKPAIMQYYQDLLEVKPNIQPLPALSDRDMESLEGLLPRKDVPILLGAILSKSQFLITLDRKDFLANKNLEEVEFSFGIVNPGEFLNQYIYKTNSWEPKKQG